MKKISVLSSRNTAFFAAQAALSDLGFRGEEFAIESFVENKRPGNARFIVLWLVTASGAKAAVAVRLVKENDQWVSRQARVLGAENAPERKLGYAEICFSFEEQKIAEKVLTDFLKVFGSLENVDPKDVIAAATGHSGGLLGIREGLESSSCQGQFPGTYDFQAIPHPVGNEMTFRVTLTSWQKDRSIILEGARGWVQSITISALSRPSAKAFSGVIAWMSKNKDKVRTALWA